ncbi:MAG: uridylate kinase [Alphaproteobacteria bacterium]|nr:uridylate kinase [Alphaproteobacteria bacterium]
MRGTGITVVKLGGSHARSKHLAPWLDVLSRCGGRAVIVTGGGAFADAVRAMQPVMHFDDRAAHHMALLAMEQYALALASLRSSFTLAASIAAIRRALREGRVPIWSPVAMVLRARDVPARWDITSDSLAAWLAGRIGAKQLLLVKHGPAPAGVVHAGALSERGVVDPAFPRFLAASGVGAALVAADGHAAAGDAIRGTTRLAGRIEVRETTHARLLPWPRSRRRAGVGR